MSDLSARDFQKLLTEKMQDGHLQKSREKEMARLIALSSEWRELQKDAIQALLSIAFDNLKTADGIELANNVNKADNNGYVSVELANKWDGFIKKGKGMVIPGQWEFVFGDCAKAIMDVVRRKSYADKLAVQIEKKKVYTMGVEGIRLKISISPGLAKELVKANKQVWLGELSKLGFKTQEDSNGKLAVSWKVQ